MNVASLGERPTTPNVVNRTARNTRLSVFLCPSDGEPHHLNSYRFNEGAHVATTWNGFDGPFGVGMLPSEATITDGLAQTGFVSERVGGSFSPMPMIPTAISSPRDPPHFRHLHRRTVYNRLPRGRARLLEPNSRADIGFSRILRTAATTITARPMTGRPSCIWGDRPA